jgi:hypothetical protein
MQYENFQPAPEDVERVARYLNSRLKRKRVTSVNGVPVDENGNIKKTKTKAQRYADADEAPEAAPAYKFKR